MVRAKDPFDISFYEGLIFTTASLYVPLVEEEFDDICQLLRMKVWRALELYDPRRSRMSVERYVFMCMKNRCKDLVTKHRRGDVYIEDQRRGKDRQGVAAGGTLDHFESQYLCADHDQMFGHVDEDVPLVPSTLTPLERRVVVLLYRDRTQAEVVRTLDLRRSEMDRIMRAIRDKMADWRPDIADEPSYAAAA